MMFLQQPHDASTRKKKEKIEVGTRRDILFPT